MAHRGVRNRLIGSTLCEAIPALLLLLRRWADGFVAVGRPDGDDTPSARVIVSAQRADGTVRKCALAFVAHGLSDEEALARAVLHAEAAKRRVLQARDEAIPQRGAGSLIGGHRPATPARHAARYVHAKGPLLRRRHGPVRPAVRIRRHQLRMEDSAAHG